MIPTNTKYIANRPYWLFLCSISALCFSLFGHSAHSSGSRSCNQIFSASSAMRDVHNLFKQIKILEKIKESNLDLHDLRVTLSPGDMAEVNVTYKGKNIGSGSLDTVENQQHPGRMHINFISISEGHSGKGLGLLMYLLLAKAAYLNGHILESSYDLNMNSEGIWKYFVKTGLAQKINSGNYEFRIDVLSSIKFQATVDHIFEQFKLRPGEKLLNTGNLQSAPQ